MIFTSTAFLPFLAVVFAGYYLLAQARWQVGWLVAASLLFYAYSQPWLLALLLSVAAVDIVCSRRVVTSQQPRAWAAVGVTINLLTLVFFKYNHLLGGLLPSLATRADPVGVLLRMPLPIGISFYVFHGISLLVDTFRKERARAVLASIAHPRDHAANTLLYISFFPQLVAGPIIKAHDFYPQIKAKRLGDIAWQGAIEALILGYFLKMVVADNLNQQTYWLAYPYFLSFSSANLALAMIGYSAQIFADFAGYSLIAIGLARLFGYNLPTNFLFPYIAQTFSEFWTRWHMSLSAWLREYLYYPLGGNRRGAGRTYVNLLTVMTLGGLWHGAAINYAVWGLWHGAALVMERGLRSGRFYTDDGVLISLLRALLVFGVVTLGWLLFKFPSFSDVLTFLGTMARNTGLPLSRLTALMTVIYIVPVVLYHLHYLLTRRGRGLAPVPRSAVFGMMLAAILLNPGPPQTFIYFQF